MDDHDRDGRPEREAAAWMIALQEQPDDAVLHRRFRRWRRSSANDAAWRELDRVSGLIRHTGRPIAVSPPGSLPVGRHWRRDNWAVAAPVAMAACAAALVMGHDALPPIGADRTTGSGEMRRLLLADGSRVTLAPHSAVAIADGSARHVRLLRGAALFQVRHDAAHPFRVVVGDAVATDLGTVFEVRREGPVMRVAMRDGLVRASCTSGWSDPDVLRPGEVEEVDCAAATHQRSRVTPVAVGSWTDGQLVVDNRPLREVVAALRPWHRGLLLTQGAGMEHRISGVYDLHHPERALAALRRAHGTTTTTVTPWVTVVRLD